MLDLLAFWTAWRLNMLDVVIACCGPVSVPRSVVDQLRVRRERHAQAAEAGHSSLSYEDGKVLHTEVPADRIATLRDDMDAALAWIDEHAAAKPVVLGDDVNAALRSHVQAGRSDMFDAAVLARTEGVLLVCDDLALRSMHAAFGGGGSSWLHAILMRAHEAGQIEAEVLVRHTADMIEAGQSFLGVSGGMIALAVELDVGDGGRLGRLSDALLRQLGGEQAEPISHVKAALEAMRHLWSTQSVASVREAATGRILENVLKGRSGDWRAILGGIESLAVQPSGMRAYVREWARGHFLPGYSGEAV